MSGLVPSALLKSRVRRPSYLKKLAKAEDLLHHFPNGAYIGWSGFTGVGYPKYVFFTSIWHVVWTWNRVCLPWERLQIHMKMANNCYWK
jgi:hypothetical protein